MSDNTGLTGESYVGIDGCKKGWIAITLAEGVRWRVDVFETIAEMWTVCKNARLILVDIPIGLPDRTTPDDRSCDKEARHLLGHKRGCSVFPAPCRPAVYANGYDHASKITEDITGIQLTRQAWGIVPKIRQVDQFLESKMSSRAKIREIHPEVCFWAFAGGKPMLHRKSKHEGFSERMDVLLSVYPCTAEIVDYALNRFLRRDVKRDDILDALVAALTASMKRRGLSYIPEIPEHDSRGLPMQMLYVSLSHC
jgi:predicted RNase H-like nuclease